MTFKRFAPALLAATVALTGVAFMVNQPARAITSVDELSDVNENHWAFEALRDLVEKYDVIEGYPDGTFRGNRAPTRWEMAAALNSLVESLGKDIARLGAEKANKSDVLLIVKLQEEFKNELAALNARTTALEARAASIEKKNEEQDSRLTLLEKTQIHGDATFGIFSDISGSGTGSGDDNGTLDAISAVGRLRLALDIPVREDREDSKIGEGLLRTRLVGAFGRVGAVGTSNLNQGSAQPFSGYSWIAGDASAFNEGIGTSQANLGAVGGGNLRTNLYVERMYYRQNFKHGIPLVSQWFPTDDEDWKMSSNLYVGVIPWRELFDKSPYRGNELTQFQNTAFITTPGVVLNYNMPMIAHQWHQGLGKSASLDTTVGLGAMSSADAYEGANLSYEARLNYLTSFLGEKFTQPGSVYVGGYHMWNGGATNINGTLTGSTNIAGAPHTRIARQDSVNSFYAGWNQEWYKGIGTTVNFLYNNYSNAGFVGTTNQQQLGANYATGPTLTTGGVEITPSQVAYLVRASISGVLNVPMSALFDNFRQNDVFGVGLATMDFHNRDFTTNGYGYGWESVIETYYKMQLNDNISVVPSAQVILNRGGVDANNFTWVLGLRTNFTF